MNSVLTNKSINFDFVPPITTGDDFTVSKINSGSSNTPLNCFLSSGYGTGEYFGTRFCGMFNKFNDKVGFKISASSNGKLLFSQKIK